MPNIYQSSVSGKTNFTSIENLKIKASLKAQEFAVDKGSEIEVTGYETVDDGFGKFPEAILNFKLIIQPNIFKVFMKSLYL